MVDKLLQAMQFLKMLLLATALLLSAPQPVNLVQWFKYSNGPSEWMEKKKLYTIGFRLIISPNGRIDRCEVEVTSGATRIDRMTCDVVMKRARFRPAVGPGGRPLHGVYRSYKSWIIADDLVKLPEIPVPTIELKVNRLPDGVNAPTVVRVMFAVDENGQPSSCTEEPSHGPNPATSQPQLVTAACEQIVRTFKATPVKDKAGNSVPSVQDAIVRFTGN